MPRGGLRLLLRSAIARRVVLFLVLLLLAGTSAKEFLHDHEPGLHEHDSCPVSVFTHALESGIKVHIDIPPVPCSAPLFRFLPLLLPAAPLVAISSVRGPPVG